MNKNSNRTVAALTQSLLHFIKLEGHCLQERCLPHYEWRNQRRNQGVWPYARVLMGHVGHVARVAGEYLQDERYCINFGSQDYLGLAQRVELKDAVRSVLDEFGVHSAGSPVLCGRTRILYELEEQIARLLGREACLIYPAAWGAGFGVITGLVRENDTILLDALSHNCLQEGARHATTNVRKFAHNSVDEIAALLREERAKHSRNGLFIVLESLYSMDSDSPNLSAVMQLAREYDAIVILDAAHDFGAMGKRGLGILETVTPDCSPDVIMGSFSKTFAANGGFVACSRVVYDYICAYSPPYIFSNAISPLQTAVAKRALEITFSPEGDKLRVKLMQNIEHIREAMLSLGMTVAGTPSPIVPVFVGDEKIARLTSKHLTHNGLLANLVEFPAVPRGKARFRFQVMATHELEATRQAAAIMAESRREAEEEWKAMQELAFTP